MTAYWLELATRIDLIDKQRDQVRADFYKKQCELAKEHHSKHRAKPMTRSAQHRFRTYPWTSIQLDELCVVRNTQPSSIIAHIVEQLADLWSRYPFDEELYLKRCDDPFEAEACVSTTMQDRQYVPALDVFDDVQLRSFGLSAARLLSRGVAVEELQRELEVLSDVLERQRRG
jgi:hypothetical protein